jgi:hypothetical protein
MQLELQLVLHSFRIIEVHLATRKANQLTASSFRMVQLRIPQSSRAARCAHCVPCHRNNDKAFAQGRGGIMPMLAAAHCGVQMQRIVCGVQNDDASARKIQARFTWPKIDAGVNVLRCWRGAAGPEE